MLSIAVRKQLRDFLFVLNLEVPAGVTLLVGASGSGKSTALKLVAGLLRPDAGSIVVNGQTWSDERRFVPPHERNVGMVFQEYALFSHLDVAANVEYGLRARSILKAERDARVRRALERLEIADLCAARADHLSGGQRQRVALARALVIEPAVLLLDEPLAALDPSTRGRVRSELSDLLANIAVPTLFVTHDQADREAFPHRVVQIERGHGLTIVAGVNLAKHPSA